MALNLGLKQTLNPFGAAMQESAPAAPAPFSQDYISNLKKTGADIESKLAKHVAKQTTSELPTFEIAPTKPSVMESIIPTAHADMETLSNEDLKMIEQAKGEGFSEEEAFNMLYEFKQQQGEAVKSGPVAQQPAPTEEPQSVLGMLGSSITKSAKGAARTLGGAAEKTGEAFVSGLKKAGTGIARAATEEGQVGSGIVEALSGVSGAALSPVAGLVGQATEETAKIVPEPVKNKLASTVSEVGKWYEAQPEDQKQRLKDIGNALDVLGTVAGIKVGGKVIPGAVGKTEEAISGIKTGTEDVVSSLASKAAKVKGKVVEAAEELGPRITAGERKFIGKVGEEPIESFVPATKTAIEKTKSEVGEAYAKAFKPSVAGKRGAASVRQAEEKSFDAVKSINDNKANISYTDANGEVYATGRAPKNEIEMMQAIEQRKKSIFDQYKAMEEATGKQAEIDMNPVLSELRKARAEAAKNILDPKPLQYIDARIAALEGKGGKVTLDEATKTVQDLNAQLKAYYRNPTNEAALTSSIDALIANNLRKGVDDVITNAKGHGYAALKKEYGALSQIEPEVAKRAIVAGRQGPAGFFDLGSIMSAGDIATALSTGNIVSGIRGAATLGASKLAKYLNTPEASIKKMFKILEKQSEAGKLNYNVKFEVPENPLGGLKAPFQKASNDQKSIILAKAKANASDIIKQQKELSMTEEGIPNYINPDNYRPYVNEGGKISAENTHEAASYLAKEHFKQAKAEAIASGNKTARIVAGGPGAGKGTAGKLEGNQKFGLVVDKVLGNKEMADLIKEGFDVTYDVVIPSYGNVASQIIGRASSKGRTLPIKSVAIPAHNEVLIFIQEMVTDPKYSGVTIRLIDNTGKPGEQHFAKDIQSIIESAKIDIKNLNEKQAIEAADKALKEGSITKQQRDELISFMRSMDKMRNVA